MVDNSFQFVLFIVFNRTEPLQYLLFLSFLKRFWRSRRKASLWWLKASFDTTLLWFLAEILLWMCLWISWISCCEASFCCFCDIQWVWLFMLVLELLDFLLHCCVLLSNFLCGLFFISPHISSKAILLWTSSSMCSSSLLSTSCCWFMASRSALI